MSSLSCQRWCKDCRIRKGNCYHEKIVEEGNRRILMHTLRLRNIPWDANKNLFKRWCSESMEIYISFAERLNHEEYFVKHLEVDELFEEYNIKKESIRRDRIFHDEQEKMKLKSMKLLFYYEQFLNSPKIYWKDKDNKKVSELIEQFYLTRNNQNCLEQVCDIISYCVDWEEWYDRNILKKYLCYVNDEILKEKFELQKNKIFPIALNKMIGFHIALLYVDEVIKHIVWKPLFYRVLRDIYAASNKKKFNRNHRPSRYRSTTPDSFLED